MRSKTISIKVSWSIFEWMQYRAGTMKPSPYKNVSRYLIGLVLFDAMVQKPHNLTQEIANDSMEQQDREFKNLIEAIESGEISEGWLKRLIKECIAEAQANIEPEAVESRLAKKIRARLNK